MGSETAKEYLRQIRKVDKMIKRLSGTLQELREGSGKNNYALSPVKVLTSASNDTMDNLIEKIIALEKQISDKQDELINLKSEAFQRIGRIYDLDQQNVLVGRYIQGKRWEDLAQELDWSEQWLFEVHRRALNSFTDANQDIGICLCSYDRNQG